ncbi:bifunctional protein GlmU [Acidimicrobiaceae bacterium]|nr:bifunctional protein GlmU [Acidimicrobiaceae bacterium]
MYEMNAIILCGGQGIRLRPLTADIPKPLVPVRGRPIIDFIVEFLRNQNVTDITLAGGYLVEKLEQHFLGDNHVKVIDTGDCDIIDRLKLLLSGDVTETLVLYGDTLSDVNLTDLYRPITNRNVKRLLPSGHSKAVSVFSILTNLRVSSTTKKNQN